MATTDARLEARAAALAESGADPLRQEVLDRARAFKRSWVDMAEALLEVRKRRAYENWGYADLHAYCKDELLLTARTVDKLVGSYRAIERHAPHVLEQSHDSADMPTVDAVNYFAQAMSHDREVEPEVVEQLKSAVFDEQRSAPSIRRQFNPILYTKSEAEQDIELLQRTRAAIARLSGLLDRHEDLPEASVERVKQALTVLATDIDGLLPKSDAA